MREPGGGGVGLGSENPDFWIMESKEPSASLHVAFVAPGEFPSVPGGPQTDMVRPCCC
jgi:hypothetical protein